ncbi:hypothetical protein ACHWQZ_G019121 [Mnemiopsis leidyi]
MDNSTSLLGLKVLQPSQARFDATQPNFTHSFLQQVIEQASKKLGLDVKSHGESSDDDIIMNYVNSIASSLSAPHKPPTLSNCDTGKFDFSLLLPKNKLRDLPINNVWFSNLGQCYGSAKKSETVQSGSVTSPSSDNSSSPVSITPPPPELMDNLLKLAATSEVSESSATYHEDVSQSRRKISSEEETDLPFDLESYQELTSPVSDMTYNVLPFASTAKILDLSTGSAFCARPKTLEVEEIKLLDIWDVLSWFALDYLLTAETLAEDRNKHLLSFGSWMRYVNTARHEQEQNIVAFQIQHDIYFEVIRDILPGQELLLWYESSYGDLLGLYRLEQLRPDSDGCYSCQICQRTFCYPYSFMMHIATRACSHSGSEVLWCDHCGMVFALPATLRSHVRTHSHERPFPCGTCPSTFAQSTALALHNQIHWYQNTEAWYNNEYKTGVSPLLSPTISSTNGIATLPAHSTTMLPNDKIFKCNKCDKAFSCNAKLERHTRVHSGIKPYTCDYCGKSFAYSTSCRRHERTHVEGKPFKCTHCQKAFSDSTNMKAHIRIHTGEKPYRCNICGREFSHSSSLKSHHRTHTGEKPFKCSHCGTCFGHLSTLRKHGMRAHGLQKRSHLQDEGQLVVKTENPNSLQTFNSPIAQPKPYPKCDGSTLPLSHVKTENTTTPLSHAKSDQLTQPLSHNRPTIAAADSSSILHVLSPEQSLT